jgi:hypothetical protein
MMLTREGPLFAGNLYGIGFRSTRRDAQCQQRVLGVGEPLLLHARDVGER